MGYRDETETLRARVEELESELGDARATIARLTGGEAPSATERVESKSPLLGAPPYVRLARELDLEVTDEGLEAIAALVRERLGVQVSQVGRSLSAPGFELAPRDGVTRVRLTLDLTGLPFGAVGASAVVGGFAAMASGAVVHDLFLRSLSEGMILAMVPFGIALAYVGFRGLFQRAARRRAEEHAALFEAVVELARRHRVPPETARVRVALEADEDVATAEAEEEPVDAVEEDEARRRA